MKAYFTVLGLPPKKDGAKSMWGKHTEAERLVKLRNAAYEALQGYQPFRSNTKVTLKAHVGPVNDRRTGDLDTFIAGVCDGLMATNYGGRLATLWDDFKSSGIYPTEPVAIEDDSQVVYIQAEKIVSDTDQPWYEVVLEGD